MAAAVAAAALALQLPDDDPAVFRHWNPDDAHKYLELSDNGLEARSPSGQPARTPSSDGEIYAVRANRPMMPEHGLCYFEVTILMGKPTDSHTSAISVGLSSSKVSLSRLPGWETESWGYHSDDGQSFAGGRTGKSYGTRYGVGDVVGCGINYRRRHIFFTKNGSYIGVAANNIRSELSLFPTVGIKASGEAIRANFGQSPFVFNLEALIQNEIRIARKEAIAKRANGICPGMDETELIQQLVLDFLRHDGHVETARALAEDLKKQRRALNDHDGDEADVQDDLDARNRKRVREAVLDGDINRALKYTQAYFPRVLELNHIAVFRLQCRKFIELVRQASELRIAIRKAGESNGGAAGMPAPSGGQDQEDTQEMDLDSSTTFERMDTDKDGPQQLRNQLAALDQETIHHGKNLRAQFGSDTRPEISQALVKIFALLAYEHPEDAPHVAHLLERSRRAADAEELNSAILAAQGKPPRAALETVWAQTAVLLADLKKAGRAGAFIDLKSVLEEIKPSQTMI